MSRSLPPRRLPASAVMIAGDRAKRLQEIGAELAAGVQKIRDARTRRTGEQKRARQPDAAPILIALDPDISSVDLIRRLSAAGLKLRQDPECSWLKLARVP